MAKYLLIWETGSNLGHLSMLLALANALRARHHQVTMILQQPEALELLEIGHNFPCMAAPQLKPSSVLDRELLNYADVLLKIGFDQPIALYQTVCAWRAIFAREKPDRLILNAAPTATLAARGMGIATILYGSGFDLPPLHSPMPAFRNWLPQPTDRLVNIETAALNSINHVLDRLALTRLQRVADLFHTDRRVLCAQPELDHYPLRAPENYWGWHSSVTTGQAFQWKGDTLYRVYLYLRLPQDALIRCCGQLHNPECEYVFFAPEADQASCAKLSTDQLTVINQAIRFDAIVKHCSLLVCHGGLGTVTTFLSNGVPLLLLPTQIEQLMTARRVVEHGYGRMLDYHDPQLEISDPINKLLLETRWQVNAAKFAEKYCHTSISEIVDLTENAVPDARNSVK